MGAQQGAEGVEEGQEVGWLAGGGGVEGWGEDCGDHEAVDCCWRGGLEGGLEGCEDVLEGRGGAAGKGDVVYFGVGGEGEAFR